MALPFNPNSGGTSISIPAYAKMLVAGGKKRLPPFAGDSYSLSHGLNDLVLLSWHMENTSGRDQVVEGADSRMH